METVDLGHHTSKRYNDELEEVRSDLMTMGGAVEAQLRDAIKALMQTDSQLANKVIKDDALINKMEVRIDEECALILARRQPAASDLRFVLSVSKTVADIERIGDHAAKIAKKAAQLIKSEAVEEKGYIEIRHISEKALDMLKTALNAFARMDVEAALDVIRADAAVNLEYQSALRVMITNMMEDPRNISHAMEVITVLRSLERVGDHCINMAEQVIYLVKGQDMRHKSLEKIEKILKK